MFALCWNGKQGNCGGGLTIAALLVATSLLVLTVPAAHAQGAGGTAIAQPEVQGPGHYLVTFGLNQTTLTEPNRRIIAQAAEDYRRVGRAQISVTGHTDTAGSAAYNLKLSEQRAAAVAAELERNGVPATDIVAIGKGEEDLLVPTADGVREPLNRRVEILVPQPPPPVVAAPAPVPPPTEEKAPEQPKNVFTIGPIYGHNYGEAKKRQSDLAGVELTYNALPGFLGGLALKQDILHSFNAENDGWAGRSILSLEFAPQLGPFRPFLSANGGGVYGRGVQDGFVAGPGIGFNLNLFQGIAMRANVAYDYQFRNSGNLDEGILWAGLGFGVAF
jgi:hypothetical protein